MEQKKIVKLVAIALMAFNASVAWSVEANTAANEAQELETVEVKGAYEETSEQTKSYKAKKSRSSTKLDLDIKDTPQSMNVLTRETLDDFNLITINQALDLVPSINVERVETDRTYFTARGFDITNFQVDYLTTTTGAVFGNVQGDIDTVIYDRVEVLRGANGMLTGTGNPSATINFVRKRPTTEFQASVTGLVGSWDQKRAVGDVSGSLNESGTVRGRFVASVEDKDSYLDRYGKKRQVVYGVLDFQLSETTALTVGHSYQNDEADSPMWGALEVAYSDGTPTDFKRSASNAADWAYWDNKIENTFVELKSEFEGGWQITSQLSRMKHESESELFYTFSFGTGLDRLTGLGLVSNPSKYKADIENYTFDSYASGPITVFGREHELVVGSQFSDSTIEQSSRLGSNAYQSVTLDQYLNGTFPEPPSYGPAGTNTGEWDEEVISLYTSAKLNLHDNVNVIVGARYTDYEMQGLSYGTYTDISKKEVIPYVGAIFSVHDQVNIYASYTEIFSPQNETGIDYKTLDPIEGETYEVGVKVGFNQDKALASVSVFKTEQNNLAVGAGTIPGTADAYFTGEDGVNSKGIELDVQGELMPGWNAIAGYTYVDIEDADGERTNTHTPKQTVKLASTYALTQKWKVGGTVKWRDETYGPRVEQGAYAIVDAMVSYQATPKLKATLNVYNVFDKEYISSVYWAGLFGQAFKGAPTSAALSVKYDF